ncbi:hypothetical protein DJ90_4553 [Paenibacillus macerans]|uniref:Uncharacterized protein n=1 Tax=Paenibacillus macerans TaxID=44252 RepID=A0A090Z6Z2_PAEMA|nr:hypothetical protein DJ90_4553 [Paenibacillus macerans]
MSLPMRERGLKGFDFETNANRPAVAPYAGAWIESRLKNIPCVLDHVAPYAGAWIESEVRRRKLREFLRVAPYAGAWIESRNRPTSH